jgi:hypothetical protein
MTAFPMTAIPRDPGDVGPPDSAGFTLAWGGMSAVLLYIFHFLNSI